MHIMYIYHIYKLHIKKKHPLTSKSAFKQSYDENHPTLEKLILKITS